MRYDVQIAGIGAVVMAPFLGGISDDYGRKPIFRIVLFAAILPSGKTDDQSSFPSILLVIQSIKPSKAADDLEGFQTPEPFRIHYSTLFNLGERPHLAP